jgi:hypothetical protein
VIEPPFDFGLNVSLGQVAGRWPVAPDTDTLACDAINILGTTLCRSCFQRQQGVNDQSVARAHSADGDQLVDRIPRQVAVNDRGHHQLVQGDRAFMIIEERRVGGVATGGYAHQALPRC